MSIRTGRDAAAKARTQSDTRTQLSLIAEALEEIAKALIEVQDDLYDMKKKLK